MKKAIAIVFPEESSYFGPGDEEFGGTVLASTSSHDFGTLPDEPRFINPTDIPIGSREQRIPGGELDTTQITPIRKMP